MKYIHHLLWLYIKIMLHQALWEKVPKADEGDKKTSIMQRSFQKELRKNQTEAEMWLWQQLRNRRFQHVKFRRQQILQGYIVDFVCLKRKWVIELDGGQHTEQIAYDKERTRKLEENGFRVLRFWNDDILQNGEEVLDAIYQALSNKS